MKDNNINIVTKYNLCTGCGICEDLCPTHSIRIERKNGENHPTIDKVSCLSPSCGTCLKVCPGLGIKLNSLAKDIYSEPTINQDKYIGKYVSLYTGYSMDYDIRYHAASGGIVTQFLVFLLEKKIIDGAVITKFSEKDHITPVSYIARTPKEIIEARSSKYCPVSLNKVGNEIKQSEGKYVIVGLPCHIQGFRKRACIDKKFNERIIGFFSIYCSSNRTYYAQDFLLKKHNVSSKDISYFAYRDNGCLGDMIIKTQNTITVPFSFYYGRLRSFFKPRRCLVCIDHYGELADVCFGDIHIEPYKNDKIGISSWIVRNTFFDRLFKQAVSEGYIHIEELDPETLNESQKAMLYSKKRKAKALINIDKILGRRTVTYDVQLDSPKINDYISVVITGIQRFIGKHKSLWFIINYLFDHKK